jgi:hypothetical protein
MKVYGLTQHEVRTAIEHVPNLDSMRLEEYGTRVPHVEVTLRVKDSRGRYARHSHRGRRMVSACWHGHERFMHNVFTINPNARIVSVMARYSGVEDFHASTAETAYRNIGSRALPLAYIDACECKAGAA